MITEKLRDEAGELDSVLNSLFEELVDAQYFKDMKEIVMQIEDVMSMLGKQVSEGCYKAYENIYKSCLEEAANKIIYR